MKFLFLEPFLGGSHKDFAQGLMEHSRHRFEMVSLPARFWKWRMRGAALHFMECIPSLDGFDGIFATDLMSVSDFKAIAGPHCPPILVYFHENQLTYPLSPGETMDYQFGFTDITTALAADRVVFNSKTHFEDFFHRASEFFRMMPEYRPYWTIDTIREKSTILYPGCRFSAKKQKVAYPPPGPPIIIWNHRWEFDKNPAAFFEAVGVLAEKGVDFRLAILGENFQAVPKVFLAARERYRERIVQYGYVSDKKEYLQWLHRGSMVVSTALQENFGISIIEAIRHGCLPLLPNRLVYPEIIPASFHDAVLYEDNRDLANRLLALVKNREVHQHMVEMLSQEMARYSWEEVIHAYDDHLERLVCP